MPTHPVLRLLPWVPPHAQATQPSSSLSPSALQPSFSPFSFWTHRLPLEVRLDLGNIGIKKLEFSLMTVNTFQVSADGQCVFIFLHSTEDVQFI